MTYDRALLRASECVAAAYNLAWYETGEYERVMDLCLCAGHLRGLVAGGEPTDSSQFQLQYDMAAHLIRGSRVVV